MPTIAIPVFGYKNHVAIDRAWGFIRHSAVTDAACYDGSMLRELVTSDNLAASVRADMTYRSTANEAWLVDFVRISRSHRQKPRVRPVPWHLTCGNASKSAVGALVEHVFAHQKERMGLFVSNIGLDRARTRIGLANLAYNFQRLVFHERWAAIA
ncbi:MAG: transposase [Chloroflexi bacterium]|nr:transposase [Chloroflexota bacterium]